MPFASEESSNRKHASSFYKIIIVSKYSESHSLRKNEKQQIEGLSRYNACSETSFTQDNVSLDVKSSERRLSHCHEMALEYESFIENLQTFKVNILLSWPDMRNNQSGRRDLMGAVGYQYGDLRDGVSKILCVAEHRCITNVLGVSSFTTFKYSAPRVSPLAPSKNHVRRFGTKSPEYAKRRFRMTTL